MFPSQNETDPTIGRADFEKMADKLTGPHSNERKQHIPKDPCFSLARIKVTPLTPGTFLV